VRFLEDADIKLVRGSYLKMLHKSKSAWPRRQEAEERERKSGQSMIFATREEVRNWAVQAREMVEYQAGKGNDHQGTIARSFQISSGFLVAVSHVWESKQHPDPYRCQLATLVQHLEKVRSAKIPSTRGGPKKFDIEAWKNFDYDYLRPCNEDLDKDWFFIDFMSLYQFKRERSVEEESFRAAMCNMHVLYAHEWTQTWIIQNLPEAAPSRNAGTVEIYDLPSDKVVECPATSVEANLIPYEGRGWCQAEWQWSLARSCDLTDIISSEDRSNKAPMAPEVFAKMIESGELKFTHRNDSGPVMTLQRKVFMDKALSVDALRLRDLPASEVEVLGKALRYYKKLQDLDFWECQWTSAAAGTLLDGIEAMTQENANFDLLRIYNNRGDPQGMQQLAEAIAAKLRKDVPIRTLEVRCDELKDTGVQVLGEALASNSTLKSLRLHCDFFPHTYFRTGSECPKALATALSTNTTLEVLDISKCNLSDETWAEAFAEALPSNTTILELDLGTCSVTPKATAALHNVKKMRPELKLYFGRAYEGGCERPK